MLLIYLDKWNHTNSAKGMQTRKCSRILQLIQAQRTSEYIWTTSGSHHHTEIRVKYDTFQKSTFGIAQHLECREKMVSTQSKPVASFVDMNKKKLSGIQLQILWYANIEIIGHTYRKLLSGKTTIWQTGIILYYRSVLLPCHHWGRIQINVTRLFTLLWYIDHFLIFLFILFR